MSDKLKIVLNDIKAGKLEVSDALAMLSDDSETLDLGHTKFDLSRPSRNGFPEVIYGAGKTPEQVGDIFVSMKGRSNLLATRVSPEMAAHVKNVCGDVEYNPLGRTLTHVSKDIEFKQGEVVVVTAGTSDLGVAEEARVTCEMLGNRSRIISDVGVAGIHRLMTRLDDIKTARVLIVVAGMEGALSSVIGGLVSQPLIAVPTSVGYGAAFSGMSALLGMLTSCASGVTVVNIDNGFGAACAANRINSL